MKPLTRKALTGSIAVVCAAGLMSTATPADAATAWIVVARGGGSGAGVWVQTTSYTTPSSGTYVYRVCFDAHLTGHITSDLGYSAPAGSLAETIEASQTTKSVVAHQTYCGRAVTIQPRKHTFGEAYDTYYRSDGGRHMVDAVRLERSPMSM